jgi:hypothetical protein
LLTHAYYCGYNSQRNGEARRNGASETNDSEAKIGVGKESSSSAMGEKKQSQAKRKGDRLKHYGLM